MFSAEWKKVFLGSTNSINLKEERHRTEEKKQKIRSHRALGCTPLAASFAQRDSPHMKDLSGPVRFYVNHGDNWWVCRRISGLNGQHLAFLIPGGCQDPIISRRLSPYLQIWNEEDLM